LPRLQISRLLSLDSAPGNTYLRLIPIHRFPAAHLCARRIFV
jgi:hypothetical protein